MWRLFMLCSEPPRIDYIATLLTVATFCLSVAVGFVAWQQWRVARNKLRLDLFDRRWQIYAATSKFIDAINNDPERVYLYRNDFNTGTSNAEFLFDSDIVNYIQQIRSRAADMETAHKLSENERRDEKQRTRNIEKFAADRLWFIEQSKMMSKTFAPYLGFENVKA